MSDGNLRQIFKDHLPEAHWQPIETMIGRGIPDVEYCFPGGLSGWIENKKTTGWAVEISSGQIAWLERRARAGGRCFVAVRRQGSARGQARDELWLFRGADARNLLLGGLKETQPLGLYTGGPAKWSWPLIKGFLTMKLT